MPALSDVLSEAASHDAYEVIMETGRPVLMNTERGGIPVGDALTEDEVFAALTAVLDQEQQVELMVGNVIEFHLSATRDWHVVTEPGSDGITIRARVAGTPARRKPAWTPGIDLPPVAPFSGGGGDLPPVAEDSFSNLSLGRQTPDDLAAIELSAEFSGPGDAVSEPGFAMPSAGELELDDPLAPLGSSSDAVDDDDVEVDIDTDDASSDFALVEPPSAGNKRDSRPSRAEMAKTMGLTPEMASTLGPEARHESATKLNLVPPPASPVADTRSDLGMVADRVPPLSGTFGQVATQVPLAGLTLVHQRDPDDVVATLGCESVLIDEGADPAQVAASLHELPAGGTLAVLRVEDPSQWLAWCLRRLEEGYGVLVHTRALNPGGAKRCLLGPSATVRAESWLGRHVVRSLIEAHGTWTLELPP